MKYNITTSTFVFLLISFISQDLFSQIGRLALSPKQKTEIKIGLTDIVIEYSRPSKREREIFGGLVPYGEYWRTGANRSTTISLSQDFIIADKKVKKGKYAIFTIPGTKEWEFVLYSDTDNWDVPEEIDDSKIVAKVKVPSQALASPKEVFTIEIVDFTNYEFSLNIAWDQTMVTVPIGLVTREMMDKKISRILTGPSDVDYYAAAEYEMEAGGDYRKGLEYINKTIDMLDEPSFWELRIKAILLAKLGERKEGIEVAQKGLSLSKEVGSDYGIREFNKVLKQLQ